MSSPNVQVWDFQQFNRLGSSSALHHKMTEKHDWAIVVWIRYFLTVCSSINQRWLQPPLEANLFLTFEEMIWFIIFFFVVALIMVIISNFLPI